jgi:hypothetical protein
MQPQTDSGDYSCSSWPFPVIKTRSGHLNLKGILLTTMQKDWIAKEIVEAGESIKTMHARCELSKQTLRRYAKNYRTNKTNHSQAGRPFFMSDDEIDEFNIVLISKGINVEIICLSALRYEVVSFLEIKRK